MFHHAVIVHGLLMVEGFMIPQEGFKVKNEFIVDIGEIEVSRPEFLLNKFYQVPLSNVIML